MNEIRVKRMLLGGLAMLVAFIVMELLVEQFVGRMLFGDFIDQRWLETTNVMSWTASNQVLNIGIALLNSTVLIWLYASLRPMYGVGTKTALITSALGIVWVWSMMVNLVNLGLIPSYLGLLEAAFEAIEIPIALLAGAEIYEGGQGE